METGSGHPWWGHYRRLIDDGDTRRLIGTEAHLRLVETAICARLDRCDLCFTAVVDRILAEPHAVITAKRFGCVWCGERRGFSERDSEDEAIEVQAVIDHSRQAREATWVILRHVADEMAGGGQCRHTERTTRSKNRRVRHPSRRMRTKAERKRD